MGMETSMEIPTTAIMEVTRRTGKGTEKKNVIKIRTRTEIDVTGIAGEVVQIVIVVVVAIVRSVVEVVVEKEGGIVALVVPEILEKDPGVLGMPEKSRVALNLAGIALVTLATGGGAAHQLQLGKLYQN